MPSETGGMRWLYKKGLVTDSSKSTTGKHDSPLGVLTSAEYVTKKALARYEQQG